MVSVLNRSRGSIFWGLGGFRVEEGDWDDISGGWEGGEGEGGEGEGKGRGRREKLEVIICLLKWKL